MNKFQKYTDPVKYKIWYEEPTDYKLEIYLPVVKNKIFKMILEKSITRLKKKNVEVENNELEKIYEITISDEEPILKSYLKLLKNYIKDQFNYVNQDCVSIDKKKINVSYESFELKKVKYFKEQETSDGWKMTFYIQGEYIDI